MLRSKKTPMALLLLFSMVQLWSQGSWRDVQANNTPLPRAENAFVKAGDKFYLLGGRGIKPVAIFDPTTQDWSEGAPIPLEVSHFQAVTYHGLIYIMGGLVGNWPSETPLSHILIYNPLTDTWLIGPEIPPHRQRGAAGTVVYKNRIFLVCGIVNGHTSGWVPWLDVYDPATNTWSELQDAPRARDHIQVAVAHDQLVVAGGRKSGYMGQGLEATVAETDVYNLNSGEWRTLASPSGDIPTLRAGFTAISTGNEVVLIGGESGSQVPAHAEAEALDPNTGNWHALPSLNRGRHGTQGVFSDGKFYIAAGCGNRGGSPELDSFESYNLTLSTPVEAAAPIIAGNLALSAPSLDFGTVAADSTAVSWVELTNTGGNQGIPIVYMVPTPSSRFRVEFPYSLPYVLAPGKSVAFKVIYSPADKIPSEALLHIKVMDRGKLQPLELGIRGN